MPDRLWGQILLQLVLILCSAFFTAAETAVQSLSDAKLRKAAEDGDKQAARILKLTEQPETVLLTIQVGSTLAGLLGAAFAARHFAGRLGDWLMTALAIPAGSRDTSAVLSVILITLLIAFLTLVLGYLVPKRLALKNPERAARFSCGAVTVIAVLLKPLVWLLTVSAGGVLRLFRIDPKEEPEQVTEEEIRQMVDVGEEKGAIASDEKEMIENIFEFNNITAADAMTHRTEMTAFWVGDETDFIVETIQQSGFSRFPVYDEDIDNIVGILNTRQFLLNLQSPNPKPLKEILFEPYLVPETVRADILFRDMQLKKIHMAVVLDEYGGTSGIITMEDLLEEIVGNIYDESDESDESELQCVGDNLWKVAGSVELDRLEKELGIDFNAEDDAFDTLNGLIFSQFAVIPADGETPELDVPLLHVQVQSIQDHRVEWALISKLPETDPEAGTEEEKEKEKEKHKEALHTGR